MTKPVKYRVTREHTGDDLVEEDGAFVRKARHFQVGDSRLADPSEVKHLLGVSLAETASGKAQTVAALEAAEAAPSQKAAPPAKDKVEPVPANKAAPARHTRATSKKAAG